MINLNISWEQIEVESPLSESTQIRLDGGDIPKDRTSRLVGFPSSSDSDVGPMVCYLMRKGPYQDLTHRHASRSVVEYGLLLSRKVGC